MKQTTIGECQEILDTLIEKVFNLQPESFQWFTADRLPKDYIYQKWIGKKKDFTDVYLNLDPEHEERFVKYCGFTEDSSHIAALLRRFFMFVNNYDSGEYFADPFHGEHAEYLSELATGEKKPQGVHAMQALKAWRKGDRAVKLYFTRCAFGVKQKLQPPPSSPDTRPSSLISNSNAA